VYPPCREKEEGEANHIGHVKRFDSAVLLGNVGGTAYDANWRQADTVWGWAGSVEYPLS
jgi:hypothetical protein